MKLYLAGPMSGYPGHNVPLFLSVGSALRARGYEVVIPCEEHAADDSQTAKSWEEWMDISLDEVVRMRESRIRWLRNRYPLVDLGMTRRDCLWWMERSGYPRPPKSACIGCPYHSDAQWREMRDEQPAEWADAVAFDRSLRVRGVRGIVGDLYLHRSLVPLDEVDLATDEERGQGNLFDGFADECEGMCGV